jgi:putative lipoprotein
MRNVGLLRLVAASTAIAMTATAQPGRADDSDKWLAADKGVHFGVSAAIAGGTYGVSAPHFESRVAPLLIGAGVSVLAGVSKEVWDAAGNGTASWKDLTWDAIGIATGLVIAWGIDVLVRARPRPRPPPAASAFDRSRSHLRLPALARP